MTDLIPTEPNPDTQAIPEQPLMEEIPGPEEIPSSSANTARTFAQAVSVSLGIPEDEERIKQEFEQSGRSQDWERSGIMWQQARTQEVRKSIVENTIKRAQALKVDPATELRGDGVGILEDETRRSAQSLAIATQSTEADAYAHVITQEPRHILDYEEYWNYKSLSPVEIVTQVQENAYETLQEFNEFLLELSEGGVKAGGVAEIIGGVAQDMMPGWYTARVFALGRSPLGTEAGITSVLPGSIAEEFRKFIFDLPPEERGDYLKRMATWLFQSPLHVSDWADVSLLQHIVNGDVLLEGETETIWDAVINIGTTLELAALGPVIRSFKSTVSAGTRFSNTTTNIAKAANPERASDDLAHSVAALKDSELLNELGVTVADETRQLLPQPLRNRSGKDVVEEIPALDESDLSRVRANQARVQSLTTQTRQQVYRPEDLTTATETQVSHIIESWDGKVRPGMMRVGVSEDELALEFNVFLGKNKTHPFMSSKSALLEVENLAQHGMDLKGIEVWTSNGLKLNKVMGGEDALAALASLQKKTATSKRGKYYVSYKEDYYMRPQDRGLFGGQPVLTGEYTGRASGWLLTPSSQFTEEVYGSFVRNHNKEEAIASALDQIVAPIFKMSRPTRREIDRMYRYTENFAIENGRVPTTLEYRNAFPDAGPDEFRGVQLTKEFYDTIYDVMNEKLYREWKSAGYVTLRATNLDATWHGIPQTEATLKPLFDGNKRLHVYDAATTNMEKLSSTELKKLFNEGGSIIKLDDTQAFLAKEKTTSTLVMYNPAKQSGAATKLVLTPLSANPLKYIEGYYPRIYEDAHYVRKISKGGLFNGVARDVEHTVGVAATRAEADRFVARMKDKDPGNVYEVIKEDPRLSGKDRTAMDLERFRLEGRLIFDQRQQKRLVNVNGGEADILSPLNAMERATRMVSKELSMTDLVAGQKQSFKQWYGDLIKGDIIREPASETRKSLIALYGKHSGKERVRIGQALELWEYISLMEGNINQGSQIFRSKAITAAEWLHEQLRGVPSATRATTWLVRKVGPNIDPLQSMKGLSFFDFIVTRPVRQLVLQSSQHLFLQALDPLYAGRWQRDSIVLLQGMKRDAAGLIGGKGLTSQLIKRNSKLMGLTEDEYLMLVDKFSESGLVPAINRHSFAGDMKAVEELPSTRVGDVIQTTRRTATAAPVREALQQAGFDLGEQVNVSSSYTMALRIYRKENKHLKKLQDFTKEDWAKVDINATNYAFAMNRANAAKFQYGFASLTTQFLQFTHKTLLIMLRALPEGAGGGLGNKTFTASQARRLVLGQFVLFGGAGFGVKPEVERLLAESGLSHMIGTTAADLLEGGLIDFILDTSLQALTDDPELDFAFDEFLAPGANIINTARNMIDIAFEQPLIEGATGASGSTLSRMWQGYQMGRTVVSFDVDISASERATKVADLVLRGMASGYNDFVKARIATKAGYWMSGNGDLHAIEATWTEILAKGILGVNTESVNTAYRINKDVRDKEKALRDTAREYFNRVQRISRELTDGRITEDTWEHMIAGQKLLLQSATDQNEWAYLMEEFYRLNARAKEQRQSVTEMLGDAIVDNVPIDQWVIDRVMRDTKLGQKDKEALIEIFTSSVRDVDMASPDILWQLNQDLESIRRD